MSAPIRVLFFEKVEGGALGMDHALRPAGRELIGARVETLAELVHALDNSDWDVLVFDLEVVGLDLDQIKTMLDWRGMELPFIAAAKEAGQEEIEQARLAGAFDCVAKNDSARLAWSIQRALDRASRRIRLGRAEAALREIEDRYQSMLEASPDSIVVYDMQGRVLYLNRAFRKTFGWSFKELSGKRVDFVPEQAQQATRRAVERMLKGELVHFFDTQRLTKDGRTLEVQLSSALFNDRKGQPAGNIVILRDMSSQKAQEEERAAFQAQLRQSQKMEAIGTLAGGIAHDFNNILGAITGYTELAAYKLQSGEPAQDELSEVMVACERARQLIKQILTFSRAGREERKPLQVSSIAKEALKLLRASLPTYIEIRPDIADGGMIMGDPIEIHQLIMNLAANAGQAMRQEGGVLEVGLHAASPETLDHPAFSALPPGDYLELRVSDTGPGIAPAIQERIFEPFFTTKEIGEGTGMGLAVVHGIVKSHGGGIMVESAPGSGAKFSVLLPTVEQDSREDAHETQAVPRGRRERILFVDDEEDLVYIAKRYLESLDYQVIAMVSPSRALELFHNKPDEFDLVVTDQTMPGLTGVQLAEEVWSERPGLPVVLCTGFSELVSPEQATARGISQFVMKPFIKANLARAVRNALDERTFL